MDAHSKCERILTSKNINSRMSKLPKLDQFPKIKRKL